MRRNKAQGFGDAFHDYLKQENLGGRWNEGLLWAKWHEVVDSLLRLPVGYTLGFWAVNLNTWNGLSPATQEFLTKQFKDLEERSWTTIAAESDEGIACNTGGTCSVGPAAKVKLVTPSEADVKKRDAALNDVVLANWAKRCGSLRSRIETVTWQNL